ncbi:arylamine N-acetyltransferase [Spongorhabdus nitratireducens]
MNIDRFLSRIGYIGNTEPSLEVLAALQQSFLLTIPFENLDIHRGIKLDFSEAAVYEKLVMQRRGGVCYENNGLFHDALKALGFEVEFIAAVMFPKVGVTVRNDHMALLVRVEGKQYLVDVGNGKAFGDPVPLKSDHISLSENVSYRVAAFDEKRLALFSRDLNSDDSEWLPRYAFTADPVSREDFLEACEYIETSPDSVFTRSRIVSLLTSDGRITLSQRMTSESDEVKQDQSEIVLTTTVADQATTEVITQEEERELLAVQFGLVLSEKANANESVLVLNSSILGKNSSSNKLTEHYIRAWQKFHPHGKAIVRDLTVNPVPSLKPESFAAWSAPADERSGEQQYLADKSNELIDQVKACDTLVVAAPMYNFSVPVELKNAQDNMARVGITFRYTEQGPEGLLGKGKQVIVVHTRGGQFQGTPEDGITPMFDSYFRMLGFEHIKHVWAEGLSLGEETAAAAMGAAAAELTLLAA